MVMVTYNENVVSGGCYNDSDNDDDDDNNQ